MPIDRRLIVMAFESIDTGDLTALKRHPLYDKNSKLINRKTFRDMKQYKSNTMLLMAVEKGFLDIVKFLIEDVKVDINYITRGGETALHRACYRNRPQIVKYLIKRGANLEQNNQRLKYTPFCRACLGNRDIAIHLLLQNGAKIGFDERHPDGRKQTPFDESFWISLSDSCKAVIEKHRILR